MKNSRNCGAPASQSISLHTFICDFCNTKNVDEDYFKEIAKSTDLGKSNRFMQLGLNAFTSDEFGDAEKHFENSISENDKNPEAWIYLGLCKAHLITASNFQKSIKGIKDALSRADFIDSTSETIILGKITIANSLVNKIKEISDYYFSTADKTFNAFGENEGAAHSSINDLSEGIRKIQELDQFDVSADVDYSNLLLSGLIRVTSYDKYSSVINKLQINIDTILLALLEIYDRNPDAVKLSIGLWNSKASVRISKLINEKRPNNQISIIETKKDKGFFGKLFS
jgi:tetratricopeptide (TPR) repeat protein